MQERLRISERRVCRVLGQPRATQRYEIRKRDDEAPLVERMVGLATQYGRYVYRRITVMLGREGWRVNHKWVERLWRREGLKVPSRQPKRRRLWLNDGSCVRLTAPQATAFSFCAWISFRGAPQSLFRKPCRCYIFYTSIV